MKYLLPFFILSLMPAWAQDPGIELFAQGFTQPVDIKHAGDDRLFVVERTGAIKVVNADGTVNAEPFFALDPSELTITAEAGMLSVAFHPNYATNGFLYIVYISSGDLTYRLRRLRVDPSDPNKALASSISDVFTLPVSGFHNSGNLAFGPDGYLYFTIGDGGGTDPHNVAQNRASFYGKMHRINVDGANGIVPYTIPADNPYAQSDVFVKELWAYGLRNAWKYSFDRLTGDLWIADVGENWEEEINHIGAGVSNSNFGWKCYEGNTSFDPSVCTPGEHVFPVAVAPHNIGHCAIAGGYVYRGEAFPNLQGKYFFSDFCRSRFGMVDAETHEIAYSADLPGGQYTFVTFGEDAAGELYVGSISQGKIFRIIDNDMGLDHPDNPPLKLSPNPAARQANIKLGPDAIPATARVYDMAGKVILKKTLRNPTSTIDVSALQSGIYIIDVRDSHGQSSQVKLAKI